MRITGPLAPEVLDRLEEILSKIDFKRTPEAFAERLEQTALVLKSGVCADVFLHAAAIALQGAFATTKRDEQRRLRSGKRQ